MPYVDGFVIPIPRKNLPAYRKMARAAAKIWMEYGALSYYECVGEDMKSHCGIPFPKLTKAKRGETVIFAWITYRSHKQRDQVNKKIMTDPRIEKMMDVKNPPFDPKRMTYGGFEVLVSA